MVLEGIDDALYVRTATPLFESSIGAHWRHCIEHYQLLLAGLPIGRVDYAARGRDERIEKERSVALEVARNLAREIMALPPVNPDHALDVKLETSGEPDVWAKTSFARELDALHGHTVHHYAMIAAMLRHYGCPADRAFGIAPSTLRYEMDA